MTDSDSSRVIGLETEAESNTIIIRTTIMTGITETMTITSMGTAMAMVTDMETITDDPLAGGS